MKKKIVFSISLIISIIFIAFACINVKAGILEHGRKEFVPALPSFNTVKGAYFLADEDTYDRMNVLISSKVINGTVLNQMEGTFNTETHTLKEELIIENSMITKISYFFDDEAFFIAKTTSTMEEDILLDKELNIALKLNDFNEVFKKKRIVSSIEASLDNEEIRKEDFYNDCVNHSFSFLYGMTYTYNISYLENDIHIVMNYFEKYTMDEIKAQIALDDKTNSSYDIIDNTYDPLTSGVGEYSFIIVAWDEAKNVSIQKVYVDVVDLIKPMITQLKPVEVEFDQELSEEDILSCFEISDIDSSPTITLSAEEYFNNKNIVGDYNATLTVKDKDLNENIYPFIIKVKDSVPPLLMYSRIIYTDYKTYYDEDKIKSLFSATDAYDGDVSSSIQIFDNDDYQNNYMNLGEYSFTIMAKDSSNNIVSVDVLLAVMDYDAPTITINQYVILAEKGRGITREQILELFQSQGYEIDGNSLNSECFSLDSLDGEYDLSIDLGDGNMEYDIITTIRNNDISFEIPNKTNSSVNLVLILSLSIGGALVIAIATMGVIVYKKRH